MDAQLLYRACVVAYVLNYFPSLNLSKECEISSRHVNISPKIKFIPRTKFSDKQSIIDIVKTDH